MTRTIDSTPAWVEPLCRIAAEYRLGTASIHELFVRAAPDLQDARFGVLVRQRLSAEPGLISAWQSYSYDKRGAPSPYVDGLEVGFLDIREGKPVARDVRRHADEVAACTDFIYREAAWVLERRRTGVGPRLA